MIYLDHNATTYTDPRVLDYMGRIPNIPMNASSVHSYGRYAKEILEQSKKIILETLDIDGYDIIFTSSGSEANNLAMGSYETRICANTEHASVLEYVEIQNRIHVDTNGILDLEALEKKVASNTGIVSIMLANNETGVVQNIKNISEVIKKSRFILHSDYIQALGKIKLDVFPDCFSIASHKIGGPQGVAALVVKNGLNIKKMIKGGGQQRGMRAGTESIILIAGFAHAVSLSKERCLCYNTSIKQMRNFLDSEIENIGGEIIAKCVERLPNTSMIRMHGKSSQMQVIYFDTNNIAVSAGSACSSGSVKKSHVLHAMNQNQDTIRVSMGLETKIEDVKQFIKIWKEAI